MMVGDPFGGKSTVLKTLAESMSNLNEKDHPEYEKVYYTVINPKAITMAQLYGNFDLVSHEVVAWLIFKFIVDCTFVF